VEQAIIPLSCIPTVREIFCCFSATFVRSKLPGRPSISFFLREELKKLDLLPSVRGSRSNGNEFLVSSSGGTVLVGQSVEGMVHYRLLESDTFETNSSGRMKRVPILLGLSRLSDKELLGFRNLKNQEKRGPADHSA